MTINSALNIGFKTLTKFSDSPDLDAALLLKYTLNKEETSWLHAHNSQSLTKQQSRQFDYFLGERKSGKPLAYILGTAEFYGREFLVNESVLVPRPETENLVTKALSVVTSQLSVVSDRPLVIADLGTGSGCIAITLALELDINIIAVDISTEALEIGRQNAQAYGVEDIIKFIEGDFLSGITDENVDLIVSNPPYVPSAELNQAGQAKDTKGLLFEPKLALDGGPAGLDFINQLKEQALPVIYEGLGGKIHTHNI